MSFGGNIPQKQMYEEMKDTPYITNLRDISQKGYEGFDKNYGKVNVFDQDTQRSLNALVNNYYKRAEGDFERQYRDTMNRYQNANYGQFGTLNATPALYRTDMQNLTQQRKLADLEYNKAKYYDTLVNSELQRRYNTLNMFNQMLGKGQVPYEHDVRNWNIRNMNKDRMFENEEINANAGGGLLGSVKGALSGAITGGITGGLPGAIIGGLGGGVLGAQKQYNTGGQGAFSMGTIRDLVSGAAGIDLGNGRTLGTVLGGSGNWGSALGNLFGGSGSSSGSTWYPYGTVGGTINQAIYPTSAGSIYQIPDILTSYGTNLPSGVANGTLQDAIDAAIFDYELGGGGIADAINASVGLTGNGGGMWVI